MNEQMDQPIVAEPLAAQPVLVPLPNPIRSRRPYKSKITSLPPEVRAFLNQSIYDNLPYDDIIKQLAARGHPGFNRPNITRWVKSGYQDWLLEKERIESLSRKIGNPAEWVKEFEALGLDGCKRLNSLMLSAQTAQAMRNFNPEALAERLNSAPELFFKLGRIINAQSHEHQRQQKIDLVVIGKADKVPPTAEDLAAARARLGLPNSFWGLPDDPIKPN